jgi:hypothetical protein
MGRLLPFRPTPPFAPRGPRPPFLPRAVTLACGPHWPVTQPPRALVSAADTDKWASLRHSLTHRCQPGPTCHPFALTVNQRRGIRGELAARHPQASAHVTTHPAVAIRADPAVEFVANPPQPDSYPTEAAAVRHRCGNSPPANSPPRHHIAPITPTTRSACARNSRPFPR